MCGILAIIGRGKDEQFFGELSKRMTHRGPDESDLHVTEKGHILSHERLSIIDLHSGKQPIQGTKTAYMVHNGEIYNHQELRRNVLRPPSDLSEQGFKSHQSCHTWHERSRSTGLSRPFRVLPSADRLPRVAAGVRPARYLSR